jgi:hypothetical protein
MTISARADAPAHRTVTLPVPSVVLPPIFHVHETEPPLSAVLASRPLAPLGFPAGVSYVMVQDAPATVCAWTVALLFRLTGEEIDVIVTPAAGG